MKKLFYTSTLFLCVLFTHAQDGTLDLSFDTDGLVNHALYTLPTTEKANAIAVQPDGKIVVAGYAFTGVDDDFLVARYNHNGSLDLTFGGTGSITTDFSNSEDIAYDVIVQPDGKIVVAGYTVVTAPNKFALARYNADGSLDATFGTGGKLVTAFATSSIAFALALQPDGKIVAVGQHTPGSSESAIVRYNTDGSLDNTFDLDGKLNLTYYPGSIEIPSDVVIQTDGKIVVSSEHWNSSGTLELGLMRLNPSGSLDLTFDSDGVATMSIASSPGTSPWGMCLQSDGKLAVTGYVMIGGMNKIFVARFNTNGSADPTFGTGGYTITTVNTYFNIGTSIVQQSDGKLLIGAHLQNALGDDFGVLRYQTNGNLDLSFGSAGYSFIDFGSYDDCFDIALQPDGKIVTTGWMHNGSDEDVGVARLHNLGTTTMAVAEQDDISYSIYPNPVSNLLVVTLEKPVANACLKLVDATGKIVLQKQNMNGSHLTLDLSDQVPGIYFLELSNGDQRLCKKLIKQ
ncbi:MAG TPA: T9SS type A sorting domain-containing protein [Flavobacteriales bacterium]|nr:T9SS type A sorting domain-containing protein [Flavobacteriales bacterium]